jgi:hypothetical protein
MYKSATKCNETIGKWCKNKHGASKIIDTFETYQITKDIFQYSNSIITPIFIGSQQTKHVELHNGDLSHVGKLMRSKHKAHGGEDNHLATAMDP